MPMTKNRATKLMSLWIFNDEWLMEECLEVVRQDFRYNIDCDSALKNHLEQIAEMIAPRLYEASFVSDLFQYAMGDVQWNLLVDELREYDDED